MNELIAEVRNMRWAFRVDPHKRREPPRVALVIRRWQARWVNRKRDVAYEVPQLDYSYSPETRQATVYAAFAYVDLPEGRGIFVLPPQSARIAISATEA